MISNSNPIRVVIFDSGFNKTKNSNVKLCKTDHKDFTGTGLEDHIGHGTHIANIIADNLNPNLNYCFIIVKWYDPNTKENSYNITFNAIQYVNTLKNIKAINYSGGGPGYSSFEKEIFSQIAHKNVTIFVAAGNNKSNLDVSCNFYPACYNINNLIVVGNISKDNNISPTSNYGQIVKKWEIGEKVVSETGIYGKISLSGTSQATAIATSKFLNGFVK